MFFLRWSRRCCCFPSSGGDPHISSWGHVHRVLHGEGMSSDVLVRLQRILVPWRIPPCPRVLGKKQRKGSS